MPQTTAQNKFSCSACGAEAVWSAEKTALVCNSCGHTAAHIPDLVEDEQFPRIITHDLNEALRVPQLAQEHYGWQTNKTEVRCQSCDAISLFDETVSGRCCDFCGATALIPHTETETALRPSALLEFRVSRNEAQDALKQWCASRELAPDELSEGRILDTVHGVYIPYWCFSFKRSHGNFTNEFVPACQGINRELLSHLEPFSSINLKPYNPGFLSGWTVERPQLSIQDASKIAIKSVIPKLAEPAHPNHAPKPKHVQSGLRFKLVLLPVWLLTYKFEGQPYQVAVNGYTGKIVGHYPRSTAKVEIKYLGNVSRPVVVVGSATAIVFLGAMLFTFVPPLLLSQANERHSPWAFWSILFLILSGGAAAIALKIRLQHQAAQEIPAAADPEAKLETSQSIALPHTPGAAMPAASADGDLEAKRYSKIRSILKTISPNLDLKKAGMIVGALFLLLFIIFADRDLILLLTTPLLFGIGIVTLIWKKYSAAEGHSATKPNLEEITKQATARLSRSLLSFWFIGFVMILLAIVTILGFYP